jgi:hypothetical protein
VRLEKGLQQEDKGGLRKPKSRLGGGGEGSNLQSGTEDSQSGTENSQSGTTNQQSGTENSRSGVENSQSGAEHSQSDLGNTFFPDTNRMADLGNILHVPPIERQEREKVDAAANTRALRNASKFVS